MAQWWDEMRPLLTSFGGKILLALAVVVAGRLAIKGLLRLMKKGKLLEKLGGEVKTFTISFVSIALNALLVISVIGILGVPMTSVITVLASAGVAIGLALQGALSNLAGGIMLMIFKPFRVGDYVEAAGAAGTVREITLFYTVFITFDNKKISVPNGTLMNANVVNFSSEPNRRVEIPFSCARQEDPQRVQRILLETAQWHDLVLNQPPTTVHMEPYSDDAMNFIVFCWCKTEDYWTVYYGLSKALTEAVAANGIEQPSIRMAKGE